MAYGRNVKEINVYVAPRSIEWYKCHNYGHIAHYCRSMFDNSMKENIDIRYKKVWKRKQEEQVNIDQVPEITILTIMRDEDKSSKKKEDVRYIKVWIRNERKEEKVNKERVQEIVLLGIVVQYESTDRKKEVKVHKDVNSTNDDDDSASKQIFF
jgi:hypothetical protein